MLIEAMNAIGDLFHIATSAILLVMVLMTNKQVNDIKKKIK